MIRSPHLGQVRSSERDEKIVGANVTTKKRQSQYGEEQGMMWS